MHIRLALVFLVFSLFGCIHPKVGVRKTRLLDPMMDFSQPALFGDTAQGAVQATFERAITSGGSGAGGSCPTCK